MTTMALISPLFDGLARSTLTSPSACDRFSRCNAPICPLDPDWRLRNVFRQEATCFYLLEAVKDGSAERFKGAGREDMYQVCLSFIQEALPRCAPLKRALDRAKKTGPRLGRKVGRQHAS
jgi:hypothetical protein